MEFPFHKCLAMSQSLSFSIFIVDRFTEKLHKHLKKLPRMTVITSITFHGLLSQIYHNGSKIIPSDTVGGRKKSLADPGKEQIGTGGDTRRNSASLVLFQPSPHRNTSMRASGCLTTLGRKWTGKTTCFFPFPKSTEFACLICTDWVSIPSKFILHAHAPPKIGL